MVVQNQPLISKGGKTLLSDKEKDGKEKGK